MNEFLIYGKAFVVGGLICCVGQALLMYTRLTSARILVLFVVSGVVLTALGVYKPLVDFAGAGATVGADRASGAAITVVGEDVTIDSGATVQPGAMLSE